MASFISKRHSVNITLYKEGKKKNISISRLEYGKSKLRLLAQLLEYLHCSFSYETHKTQYHESQDHPAREQEQPIKKDHTKNQEQKKGKAQP